MVTLDNTCTNIINILASNFQYLHKFNFFTGRSCKNAYKRLGTCISEKIPLPKTSVEQGTQTDIVLPVSSR